ncbi:restriction endonuclease subunit S [Campylobacter lari]|nr:restriction endonuclease subunit S [Campylobacter lari]
MKNFKDSGIEWLGEIPQHWEVSKFKYFYRSNMGETILAQDLKDEGIPIYSATEDDKFFGRIKNPINLLNINDFVIPARGNSIGAVKIVKEKSTCTQTTIFSKQFKKMNPYYVYYFLLGYRKFLFEFTQTAIPQITISQVNDNPILYPPLKEQEQIANFLDEKCEQMANFIEKKEKLINLLKEQKQALINETITKGFDKNINFKDSGIEWLGEIPQHWEIVKLKYIISEKLTYGANETAELSIKEHPRYIRITDFDENGFLKNDTFRSLLPEIAKNFLLSEGDILFARSGATVGKTFHFKNYQGMACYAGYLIKASINQKIALSDYIFYYTKSYYYMQWKELILNKATIENIGADKYSELKIPLPSLKEQEEIVNFLDEKCEKIDLLIEKTKKQIELIKEYKTILINQAVCGRINL